MADMDLTEAVEAAARADWDRISAALGMAGPYDESARRLALDWSRPIIAAAAPVIRRQVVAEIVAWLYEQPSREWLIGTTLERIAAEAIKREFGDG